MDDRSWAMGRKQVSMCTIPSAMLIRHCSHVGGLCSCGNESKCAEAKWQFATAVTGWVRVTGVSCYGTNQSVFWGGICPFT